MRNQNMHIFFSVLMVTFLWGSRAIGDSRSPLGIANQEEDIWQSLQPKITLISETEYEQRRIGGLCVDVCACKGLGDICDFFRSIKQIKASLEITQYRNSLEWGALRAEKVDFCMAELLKNSVHSFPGLWLFCMREIEEELQRNSPPIDVPLFIEVFSKIYRDRAVWWEIRASAVRILAVLEDTRIIPLVQGCLSEDFDRGEHTLFSKSPHYTYLRCARGLERLGRQDSIFLFVERYYIWLVEWRANYGVQTLCENNSFSKGKVETNIPHEGPLSLSQHYYAVNLKESFGRALLKDLKELVRVIAVLGGDSIESFLQTEVQVLQKEISCYHSEKHSVDIGALYFKGLTELSTHLLNLIEKGSKK